MEDDEMDFGISIAIFHVAKKGAYPIGFGIVLNA